MKEEQQKAKFFCENYLTMSDAELGKPFDMTKDQSRALRKKLGLIRDDVVKDDLKDQGLDENNWKHAWVKTDNTSIFIRNNEGIITYEEMREQLLKDMQKHAPKYPKIPRKKTKDGHLLIVDPADIHIGKLSLLAETNEEYNITTAKKRCLEGVKGLLQKASGFPLEKILLVIGNDILHIDTPYRKTTAGTPQDTDGQWWQMFLEAKALYVEIVEILMQVADVEVVFCPSNHDYASGFMLADTLSSWFHNSKNITFENDIVHRKYIQYGLNMLAFDHGDGCKVYDTKDLMADEAPKMWGQTKFRYSYKHHLHHRKKIQFISAKDHIGLTIQYLRSPSSADGWHSRNGYISPKAVEGFVHHPKNGQVCCLTHYFID